MQTLCSSRSRDEVYEKAKQSQKTNQWSLRKDGVYTADARAITRTRVKGGCSQGKVGVIIQFIAKKQNMSRRTVQRALIEGGIATRLQVVHEMVQADGATLSSDATSLRGENYEGAFVMINKGTTHKMRMLSLTSTVLHGSETQLVNLKHQISSICTLYRRSPLGQRSQFNFEGGNGDHAADVKKFHRLGKEWKKESSRILLGYEEPGRMEPQKVIDVVREILEKNLAEAGGADAWKQLPDAEKNVRTKSSMDTLALRLGEEVFSLLPPETKREINLFFWAGCSMRKELNCCKVFDEGMQEHYEEHPELEPPVLLANKDNAATIELAEDTGESTPAHRKLMDFVENNKTKRSWNHMEQNIVKGLNCKTTISLTLCLFTMAVMHPYAAAVRGSGLEELNMLDLRPFHQSVKAHMRKLIANSDPLISTAPDSYKFATLDGK
ncbi:hypothetical protein B0H16DRAFT_1735510 [Mycena metata]|uniref:Uncharacterized protein n=1 Tax=Mycena metata TaxID=1033252 RepID=A0AAD7MPZ8_9AGAR|nr:hypothetical protein B0H16DRAFT_1735510 [Mycena metata]